LAALALAGCTAHVTSALRIDGAPFTPTTCLSGEGRGFSGIELGDADGRRLRLGTNLDGTTWVAAFQPGQAVGEVLGPCARATVRPGTGVVNGVRNLEGDATLACATERRRVDGTVRFENCH
jgi:hypothetical protein